MASPHSYRNSNSLGQGRTYFVATEFSYVIVAIKVSVDSQVGSRTSYYTGRTSFKRGLPSWLFALI